jgi:hypothetical protein
MKTFENPKFKNVKDGIVKVIDVDNEMTDYIDPIDANRIVVAVNGDTVFNESNLERIDYFKKPYPKQQVGKYEFNLLGKVFYCGDRQTTDII